VTASRRTLPWTRGGDRAERRLLRAAKRGSPQALDALARAHWPSAYRIALGIVRNSDAAEDVAQEALVAAIHALPQFDPRRPFAPWLHRIVTNRAIDWGRTRARRTEVVSGDPGTAAWIADGDLSNTELSAELSAALSALSPTERAVLILRHVLGYSSEEIAGMLDKPPGTVRSLLHRALERLRERLDTPATRSEEEVARNG
jgi:RNA polymerase sigma factor (sigma-70 family)